MILLCFTELAITLRQEKQGNCSLPRGLSYVALPRCTFCHPSIQNEAKAIAGEWVPAWLHHHQPADGTQLSISASFDSDGAVSFPAVLMPPGTRGGISRGERRLGASLRWQCYRRKQQGSRVPSFTSPPGQEFETFCLKPVLVWSSRCWTCSPVGRDVELRSPLKLWGMVVAPCAWTPAAPRATRSFPDVNHGFGFDL